MTAAVIRYRTKPEAADENQRLIEKVFAELAEQQPAGLSYQAFRLSDGVSFVHVVDDADGSLRQLAAFEEFQRDLTDRLAVQPEREEGTRIGGWPR
ncbi:conserved hypothetical protein [Kribbella flavida DSM 17836]|uniref:ABM domain-containing protein n=1 Tax=Kribbella flavida (strain DSM 17836 / JCM 10339 / NBRC 14399) TaxID=479435 RepID=D2PVY9_KRIFD|nr:hypothetical protein [Kribbella flavida]ADB29646.1 conserved hypothetical protein [Kribbella flavida DSM 17836]